MSISEKKNKTSSLFFNSEQKLTLKGKKPINKLSPKKLNSRDTYEISEESPDELLSKILDTINTNSLNVFYPDSNNEFKKKIDSLNLEFYLETEKFLTNKNHSEKCQTSLFIILFKQINIYIEEIERLNLIIMKKKYDPKKIIERTDEIIKKQNEFLTKENLIKALKDSKSNMENKLLEAIISENKLKKEIELLKKEKEQYKNQITNNNINNYKLNNLNNNNSNTNTNNNNGKINLLHKLTFSYIDSKTIDDNIDDIPNKLISKYENKNKTLENDDNNNGLLSIRKRNNSDNKNIILNNSLNKLDSRGYFKSKKMNRKPISIKLIDKNSRMNLPFSLEYKGARTNINKIHLIENKNKTINNIKTEYDITDSIDVSYKKILNINDKVKINFEQKRKEIRDKTKEKDKNNNFKEKNRNSINNTNNKNINILDIKDIKDNIILPTTLKSHQINIGKNGTKKKVKNK